MFVEGKTQCCQDTRSSQLDLWIQCSPNQTLAGYFTDIGKPSPKLYAEAKVPESRCFRTHQIRAHVDTEPFTPATRKVVEPVGLGERKTENTGTLCWV